MSRVLAKETTDKISEKIELAGWVDAIRLHGKLIFIDLRDRSGIVQVVINKGDNPQVYSEAKRLKPEHVVSLTGLVRERDAGFINSTIPTGTVEVEALSLTILSESQPLPFDMSGSELEVNLSTLLDYRSLTLRHKKVQSIFRLQETIVQTFRETMKRLDFTEFQAPTIVASATEGGSEVFPIRYYDYDAFLAQSPQLYKQIMVSIYERVFTVAHAYRAEPSVTTRHLSEYVGMDAEMGFIKDFSEVMDVVELLVKDIFLAIAEKHSNELKVFNTTVPVVSERIPRLKLKEAQQIIFERSGRDNRTEPDLEPEDEREICRWAKEEKGSELIFITHYPTSKRPFYTYPDPKDPEYTCSFDLLGRGVEWVTGGQRIHEYDWLAGNIEKRGLNRKDFETYLQAFRWGMPPEGGFCLGLERITQLVLGLGNVREASLFPRDMERVDQRLSLLQPNKKSLVTAAVYEKITELLKGKKIEYQAFEHEPVFTSEQAAKARGTDQKEGAKALVMYADDNPVLLVLSATLKVDNGLFKKTTGSKDLRMATPEEVKKLTGIEVGAVPPFGNLMNLKTYFDTSISENEMSSFNAGSHTQSLRLKSKDLIDLVKPEVLLFSK